MLQQKQQKRPVVEAQLPRRVDERIVLDVDLDEVVERRQEGELLQTRELSGRQRNQQYTIQSESEMEISGPI